LLNKNFISRTYLKQQENTVIFQ